MNEVSTFTSSFITVVISLNPNFMIINRKTDSLLDWLAACGGLVDGLKYIGSKIISPYTNYTL